MEYAVCCVNCEGWRATNSSKGQARCRHFTLNKKKRANYTHRMRDVFVHVVVVVVVGFRCNLFLSLYIYRVARSTAKNDKFWWIDTHENNNKNNKNNNDDNKNDDNNIAKRCKCGGVSTEKRGIDDDEIAQLSLNRQEEETLQGGTIHTPQR